jgi:hypothetical protein
MAVRDDIVTVIQTAKVKTGFGNTVDEALKVTVLDEILKRVLNGEDRYQILSYLNRERRKGGKDKQEVIDWCWNIVKEKVP